MPEPLVSVAHAALLEITPEETVGELVSSTPGDDGLVTVLFESALPGYPGWKWTVSLAQLDDAEPTVLETELVPGDGSLLAPDWVPWSDRLADYKAAQENASDSADDDSEGDDDSDEDDDDSDDEDDDDADEELDEDDVLGNDVLHGGDLDGVDIDDPDEADDSDDTDDADDSDDSDEDGDEDDDDDFDDTDDGEEVDRTY